MAAKNLRVLRLPAVKQKISAGRDFIYRGVREGWFPAPIKLGERASGWIESEIDAFIVERAKKRAQ